MHGCTLNYFLPKYIFFVGHKEKHKILIDPGSLHNKECSKALILYYLDIFWISALNLLWLDSSISVVPECEKGVENTHAAL